MVASTLLSKNGQCPNLLSQTPSLPAFQPPSLPASQVFCFHAPYPSNAAAPDMISISSVVMVAWRDLHIKRIDTRDDRILSLVFDTFYSTSHACFTMTPPLRNRDRVLNRSSKRVPTASSTSSEKQVLRHHPTTRLAEANQTPIPDPKP